MTLQKWLTGSAPSSHLKDNHKFLPQFRFISFVPCLVLNIPFVMRKHPKIIQLLLIGYVFGLLWGQVRLPFAAVKSLADYRLLEEKPILSVSDDQLQMWPIQRQYFRYATKAVDGSAPPLISAEVRWNCGVVARVRSEYYASPLGAEWLDALYVCVFGFWLKAHNFSHTMA